MHRGLGPQTRRTRPGVGRHATPRYAYGPRSHASAYASTFRLGMERIIIREAFLPGAVFEHSFY